MRNTTTLYIPEIDCKTPRDWMLGETDDISHIFMHDLYDPVKYTLKPTGENPTYPKEDKDQIGQYLSLSCNAAKVNAYYVLTQPDRVVTRMDVRPFSAERLWDPFVQKRIENFDSEIKRHWDLDDKADVQQAAPTFPEFYPNLMPWENDKELDPIPESPPDTDYFTPEEYNQHVSSQIRIPINDEEVITTVKRRKCDINGKPIVIYNENPLINTRLYKVELHDGAIEELVANAISENLWSQCDEDGFMYQILDKIVDHCTNGQVISTNDAYIDTPSDGKLCKTTIGWELCFRLRTEKPLG